MKLCECGCGQPTSISKYTDNRTGAKRGQPVRFIRGHSGRVNPKFHEEAARVNAQRAAKVVPRRKRVAQLYREGLPEIEIAHALGTTKEIVARDVEVLRLGGESLPYRCEPTTNYVTEEVADEIEGAWRNHASVTDIGKRFGWTHIQAQTVVSALRSAGYAIDHRKGVPVRLSNSEKQRVIREYRKRMRSDGPERLTEKQKPVLRLLQASPKPLAVAELHSLLLAAGERLSQRNLAGRLLYMRKRELVASVLVPKARWFERRNRWFVPLGAERPAETMTLADAERETELATLIAAQEDDQRRGEWTQLENRHGAKSDLRLDAAVTEDGHSFYEVLGDDDPALLDILG